MKGELPTDLPVEDNFYDLVLCSMVLHCIQDPSGSIKNIFSKAKPRGTVSLIDFRDSAERAVGGGFINLEEENERYARGLYRLSDKVQLTAEVYFHKEAEIEKQLRKLGAFKKDYLGPLFVGYRATKRA
jgi:ubiquinone/menaquinone biosynthesis C-methylase UbiE